MYVFVSGTGIEPKQFGSRTIKTLENLETSTKLQALLNISKEPKPEPEALF